jgi:hypothetical protein
MATLMTQTLPEGVPVEMLDAVSSEMNVDGDPPAGLVVHVHYFEQGRARVLDVWESQDDYQRFAESRLMPAMQKVAAQNGMQLEQPPAPEFTELHAVVRGR